MLGKYEHDILENMTGAEFARWCAYQKMGDSGISGPPSTHNIDKAKAKFKKLGLIK